MFALARICTTVSSRQAVQHPLGCLCTALLSLGGLGNAVWLCLGGSGQLKSNQAYLLQLDVLSGGATEPGAIAALGLGRGKEAAAIPVQGRGGGGSVECGKCRERRGSRGFCTVLEGCVALFREVKHTRCTELFLVWG